MLTKKRIKSLGVHSDGDDLTPDMTQDEFSDLQRLALANLETQRELTRLRDAYAANVAHYTDDDAKHDAQVEVDHANTLLKMLNGAAK